MCEYSLQTEFLNIIFQAPTANEKMPGPQMFQHGRQRDFQIDFVWIISLFS